MKTNHVILAVLVVIALAGARMLESATTDGARSLKKWKQHHGWGWVWGKDDEVGSLNEMTNASRLNAVNLVKHGKVFDLGISYNRQSYAWPGHSPGEIMSFRTPEGVKRQADLGFVVSDARRTGWHSCAIFMNDNVATQIDSLCHATEGDDNHWYNGFTEAEWGGNWGPRRCDASTIPPIVARGVLMDVPRVKGLEVLPSHYPISVQDLKETLAKQKVQLQPGDVVLVRTGTLQFWGETGADHESIDMYDSAGLTLESARWLVEEHGAMMLGTDTSGLEYKPHPSEADDYAEKYKSFMPVHNYLLIEQGVHIAEFHNLEELAADGVYEFCYMCTTAKIKGSTAGFALRPIALK
ncbi:MAG: cyclase family protein [Pirellulaceae bacterium]|nr:cyclase family protein [Pirellulaceae bacterium]